MEPANSGSDAFTPESIKAMTCPAPRYPISHALGASSITAAGSKISALAGTATVNAITKLINVAMKLLMISPNLNPIENES